MRNFFLGMLYPLKGIKYLLTPGLKRFILLPLAFNLMMFVGLFYLVQHFVLPYAYYYLDKLPSWLSFLSSVLFIIFVLSYFLMFLSLFTVFFNLAAAPFNGLLSERTQNLLFQSTIPPIPFHKMVIRSIKRQGEFLGYFLPRFLIMGILFFIPLLQPIYPFLWFLFNAWILSIQYQDFAMDNNLVSFKDMRRKVAGNKMRSLGFGFSINLISFIPLLNLLTMPTAVIAGTLLYFRGNDHLLEKQNPNHKKITSSPTY
ncbi:sulfate transporter CysZ [Fluoribacter dumoffii]|uniref:Putative sulfate transport protein CysZ n=1 Tax=Fluoribacter dumoffii TaxID=463 RepID=A0A377G7L0_9GAMM|nr:sulfate transporter CysZ [Fluoribacter dumoffii]KTC89633.1 putative sulfate transport protein CysZ [Fluoribacter dumoffii NY 23]MCW8384826.1 sulfate transporter CysZ [Fluoribacter dumoffii]MCW8417889.1 sulfate transporter CysZ [Fluoribacter dumoffii]MCW8454269.1 sulfate transporter CysZ [Fluoribacter dumoffii]MCW8461657.1 sulfate transporter CysZ [Fluoribacter dumoffii]